jgi:hypothetical protein
MTREVKPSTREYAVTYSVRLTPEELRAVRSYAISIDEVVEPGGWTRTLLAPRQPKTNREESCCNG